MFSCCYLILEGGAGLAALAVQLVTAARHLSFEDAPHVAVVQPRDITQLFQADLLQVADARDASQQRCMLIMPLAAAAAFVVRHNHNFVGGRG